MISFGLFGLYSLKLGILSTIDYPSILFLAILASIVTLFELKHRDSKIEELTVLINEQKKAYDDLKAVQISLTSSMSSMKLAQNFKTPIAR